MKNLEKFRLPPVKNLPCILENLVSMSLHSRKVPTSFTIIGKPSSSLAGSSKSKISKNCWQFISPSILFSPRFLGRKKCPILTVSRTNSKSRISKTCTKSPFGYFGFLTLIASKGPLLQFSTLRFFKMIIFSVNQHAISEFVFKDFFLFVFIELRCLKPLRLLLN